MKLLKLLFILLLMSWNSYPREPKGCLSMAQNRIVEGQKVVQCYKLPDEVGNLYKSSLRSDRKYGPNGQLLEDEQWRYRYDEEGNLVEKSNLQERWQYDWYATGMLKEIVKPNGQHIQYEYDALGRRTAKIVHEKITRYCWDGNVLLHEFDYKLEERPRQILDDDGFIVLSHPEPVNNLVTWIYDSGSFVPSAKIIEDKKYSILSDYLGRPAQAYNEEGEIVWSAEYDIYGKITKLKGDKTFVPFRQLGQYEDAETPDLYYNRFRYYDCKTGLYLSQDPLSLYGANPTLYAYVGNSNRQIDPFGLSSFDPFEFGEITEFPKDLHFGQNRVAPNFSSIGSQASSSIAGRSISDVANDLSTNKLDPNEFIISYTKDPQSGKFVTLNNRGLAALSESGKFPNSAIYVPYEKVPKHLVADIKTRPPLKTIDVTLNKDGSGLLRTIKNCN